MKLQNRKTGEVLNKYTIRAEEGVDADKGVQKIVLVNDETGKTWTYLSLSEFNEDWEDYEEPKMTGWYFINDLLNVREYDNDDYPCRIEEDVYNAKKVGNYFETKEEAEKAVEKLKAWKRLKDKGVKFIKVGVNISDDDIEKDLDLLFGGKE